MFKTLCGRNNYKIILGIGSQKQRRCPAELDAALAFSLLLHRFVVIVIIIVGVISLFIVSVINNDVTGVAARSRCSHPLLGDPVPVAGIQIIFIGIFNWTFFYWVLQHRWQVFR